MSSRLVRSAGGRPVAVEITTPLPYLEVGYRYRVLGDEIRRPDRFAFTGETDARSPTPEEVVDAPRRVGRLEGEARTWTDEHRAEARRLQAQGLSWSQVAERVCGDKRFKSTVQGWLRVA